MKLMLLYITLGICTYSLYLKEELNYFIHSMTIGLFIIGLYKLNAYLANLFIDYINNSTLFILIPAFNNSDLYKYLNKFYPFLFNSNTKMIRAPLFFKGGILQSNKNYYYEVSLNIEYNPINFLYFHKEFYKVLNKKYPFLFSFSETLLITFKLFILIPCFNDSSLYNYLNVKYPFLLTSLLLIDLLNHS